MANKYVVVAFLDDSGAPATGLAAATVDVRKVSDGSLEVSAGALVEVGGGWYRYLMTNYDPTIEYVVTAYAGAGAAFTNKYAMGASFQDVEAKIDQILVDMTFITDMNAGKWELTTPNNLKFYKADNTTLVASFQCFDALGSPTISDIAKVVRV